MNGGEFALSASCEKLLHQTVEGEKGWEFKRLNDFFTWKIKWIVVIFLCFSSHCLDGKKKLHYEFMRCDACWLSSFMWIHNGSTRMMMHRQHKGSAALLDVVLICRIFHWLGSSQLRKHLRSRALQVKQPRAKGAREGGRKSFHDLFLSWLAGSLPSPTHKLP